MDGCVNIVGANVKPAEHYSNILTMYIITLSANTVGKDFQPSVGAIDMN